eukprot:scaffold4780_cov120-Isochrysis_galbana.AAC.2
MTRAQNNSSPLAEGNHPPPSLNAYQYYQARLSPLATLDEEAELLFSDTLHDHLTEHDLAQYTVNRPQQNPTTQTERIRQRHTEWIPEAGPTPTQEKHRRKRPVGPWGHSGNLKEGTSSEGKGK